MKYWSRVSGNRWLVAKMFGVLMVPLYPSLFWHKNEADPVADFLLALGFDRRIDRRDLPAWLRRCASEGVLCA